MKQLTYIKAKKLVWDDVTEPTIVANDDALVRPFIVARCDLDAAFLFRDAYKFVNLGKFLGLLDKDIDKVVRPNLFKGPFPFGHECVAEIVALGKEVRNFRLGQKVIIPFQLSCGECPVCSSGLTSQCEKTGAFEMYSGIGKHVSNGGTMSETLRVPYANKMLIPIPEGLNLEGLGSASDNLPDAWSRVAPFLRGRPGQKVLIIGGTAKSVGLYAAAFAAKMDTKQVDYVDTSEERTLIAHQLGANGINKRFQDHSGDYDLVVNASSSTHAIDYGLKQLKSGGVLTSAMIYLNKKVNIPYFRMYAKNLTLKTGLANPMADIPQMLEFIKEKQLRPELVTTLTGSWDKADTDLLQRTTKVMIKRNPLKTD